jgi:Co/Zn/Cd efflux system component
VWSQEGEHHVLTADLVVECAALQEAEELAEKVRSLLREAGVEHVTLQLASSDGEPGHLDQCG